MVRTVKDPQVRREEIMDSAVDLFARRGVEDTSVNDIIQKAGVAKGTFYWYFKSKEELLDALVRRETDRFIEEISSIVEEGEWNAVEKLRRILDAHNSGDEQTNVHNYFHRAENALAHQKHLIYEMRVLAPLLAGVVKQGVNEGLFDTSYPLEVVEFLIVAIAFVLDPFTGHRIREVRASRFTAIQDVFERALGAKPGSLSFLKSLEEFGERCVSRPS